MDNNEVWCVCPGFPAYSVSSLGRVRRETGGRSGATAGRVLRPRSTGNGYHRVDLYDANGQHSMKIHRLVAMAFVNNPDGKPYVDHINGVRTDNRLCNLRWATHSQNQKNTVSRAGSSSRFLGVSLYKPSGKWQVYIKINGKNKYIGYFSDEEEAARAYDAAAREYHGDFARPNFD